MAQPEPHLEWSFYMGDDAPILLCAGCGKRKPCQLLPYIPLHDEPQEWYCRPCWLEYKYEQGA